MQIFLIVFLDNFFAPVQFQICGQACQSGPGFQVVQVVQVVHVVLVIQVDTVVRVVRVVRVVSMISLDDMHSENIWFKWPKPSKYREKLANFASIVGT